MDKISVNNAEWRVNDLYDGSSDYKILCQSFPEIVARVLVNRGIGVGNVDEFMYPKLSRHLLTPFALEDMEKAALRLAKAITDKEKVFIFGDYDVDGATSASVLSLFLRYFGIETEVKIPERDEGYGPNADMMSTIKKRGYGLVFTVDCGTTAFEMIDNAAKEKLDVIIVDHHQLAPVIPNVYAFVNPKRKDEENNPYYNMAAVGVVFLLIVAVNAKLREQGIYKNEIKEPDIRNLLELVALGTICDMVCLRGINRTLVKTGLSYFGYNAGLRALSKNLVKGSVRAYHMGFILGPRINAAGRVGSSSLGFKLLNSENETEASNIVDELESLNALRREIEAAVMKEAVNAIESSLKPNDNVIIVGSKNWHQGVIGIVAGKLRERYGLTTLVLSYSDDGIAKGSGRSNDSIDLGYAVTKAVEMGILEKGGGHMKAAGFSIREDKINDFKIFLENMIKEKSEVVPKVLDVDAIIDVKGIDCNLAEALNLLEPYGEGNPEPLFMLKDVILSHYRIFKENMMIVTLKSLGGRNVIAKLFRQSNCNLFDRLSVAKNSRMDVVGYVKISEYRDKKGVDFILVDAKI